MFQFVQNSILKIKTCRLFLENWKKNNFVNSYLVQGSDTSPLGLSPSSKCTTSIVLFSLTWRSSRSNKIRRMDCFKPSVQKRVFSRWSYVRASTDSFLPPENNNIKYTSHNTYQHDNYFLRRHGRDLQPWSHQSLHKKRDLGDCVYRKRRVFARTGRKLGLRKQKRCRIAVRVDCFEIHYWWGFQSGRPQPQ